MPKRVRAIQEIANQATFVAGPHLKASTLDVTIDGMKAIAAVLTKAMFRSPIWPELLPTRGVLYPGQFPLLQRKLQLVILDIFISLS